MRKKFTVSAIFALLLSLFTGVNAAHAGGSYKVNGSGQSASINSTYSMTAGNTYSFDFTGTSWATVKVKLWGAGGGSTSNAGGAGGYVEGILNVGTYKTFTIVVGGAGTSTYSGTTVTTPGGTAYYTTAGFNGGGRGVSNSTTVNYTGAGGGATDLRLNFTTVTDYANANRILVAGGGGGSTANSNCLGGAGGYPNGSAGQGYGGADGGTQSAGGSLNGSFGQGGENINNTGWNGGGGGGWYGGGAQKTQHGGGAGGSSYYDSAKITSFAYGTGSAAATGGSATLTILTDGDTTPPTITSANTFSVNENATSIATVTANETSTWTISAGVDSATVQVNSSTGALTFKTARNFESPGDADLNNTYIFTVMATDSGGNTATQSITVTILNLNEAPTLTSNGGGDTATITIAENNSGVTTVQATDPDSGTTLTFSISGSDSADFVINSASGSLSFASNPDFENALDSNGDNRYQINLVVSDGALSDTQTVTVVITDVTETVFLGALAISGNPQKGIAIAISSTSNVAGKATFYLSGKKMGNCLSIATSGSGPYSISCSWKPALQGRQFIYFVFKPSAQGFLQTTSSTLVTTVVRRTGLR
jgi:hypothetical protein